MRILGLDLGTTSVGFALIDYEPQRDSGSIVRMGVRIFPEGVAPGTSGKVRESRNAKRRSARLMRRQLRRRRWRRRELGALLHDAGLLPAYGTQEWHRAMRQDPYELRQAALQRALAAPELGRAIYHLHKRRGFAGGRLSDGADIPGAAATEAGEDVGLIKQEIADLRKQVGSSTLGAWLAGQDRKRGRHLGRDQVEAEFERLVEHQAAHHPELLTAPFRARLRETLFEQRPTFWRRKTLGRCPLMPAEKLCAKGSWIGRQFVALEHLNKLRLVGHNARPLDDTERGIIYGLLMRQRSVTFGGIRKALRAYWRANGWPKDMAFNMEREDKALPGNGLEARLHEIFGDGWQTTPHRNAIRDSLAERLFAADYREAPGGQRIEIRSATDSAYARRCLATEFAADWQLDDERAAALAALELPSGWLRYSAKAVARMLVEMERGVGVGELLMSPAWESWREETFPDRERPTGEVLDRLPSEPAALGDLRNPTVNRTLNEMRKVVNNLIAVHGKPDLIRVELARDLRKSGKRRAEMEREMAERERRRKKAAADLRENGLESPSRGDIEKWLLWKECNETCPYTGRKIGFRDLFFDGLYQVEHIFPRSRTLDNSFANKTLCYVEVNREKGERSPHEAFGGDQARWDAIRNALESARLPDRKVQRFLKENYSQLADGEDFAERQLRDTAYAARHARDFLRKLYPDVGASAPEVETCNGSITAELRRQWGLESLLAVDGERGKNRADHRHHAVDALAVALTSRAAVRRLADWHAADRQGRRPSFDPPWQGLLSEAKEVLSQVIVSHRSRRKVSGPLHAETRMGDTCQEITVGGIAYRYYATRKSLVGIGKDLIESIADAETRRLVQAHIAARGGDPKKAFPPFPRRSKNGIDGAGPEIRRVRVWVKQQPRLMVPLNTATRAFADPSANHHMAIFRDPAGKVSFEIVSLHEASQRLRRGEPVVRRQAASENARFVMSLGPGDMLAFPEDGQRWAYRVVTGVWANGQVVLADHTSADSAVWRRPAPGPILAAGAKKVLVDPIGRWRDASD